MCELPDLTDYRQSLATAIGATGPKEAIGAGAKIDHQLTEYLALNKFLAAHRVGCDQCEAALGG